MTRHFVGVGGVGMSGLAAVLRARGASVTGCDRAESPALDRLRTAGVTCAVPHDPAHLDGVSELVVSTAIDADEPELLRARALGLPVRHRSEALAAVLDTHTRRVVVTGAHGKTTTSAMLAVATTRLGLDPTFLVGGPVPQLGANWGAGGGSLAIAEGDESDRSVARLPVDLAVVLNVDLDHLDHYASADEVRDVLGAWAATVPPDGLVVLGDGVDLRLDRPTVRFGLGPGDGLRALDAESTAAGVGFRPSRGPAAVRLRVPGVHNASNACAAALVLEALGVPLAAAFEALETFTGAGRRFETVGVRDGIRVIDDYAHHPVELAATIAAARDLGPERLVVYFQPHQPWRTRAFTPAFVDALEGADVAVISETYIARGRPDAETTARRIVEGLERARRPRPVVWAPTYADATAALRSLVRSGDLVLCCGAGPVDQVARAVAS